MGVNEWRAEEYRTLRQEILVQWNAFHDYTKTGFTVAGLVAGAIGIGLNNQDPNTKVSVTESTEGAPMSFIFYWLCTSLWAVIFALTLCQVIRGMGMCRIGRYIEFAIEPKTRGGLNYETVAGYVRSRPGNMAFVGFWELVPLGVVQALSLSGAWYFHEASGPVPFGSAGAVAGAMIAPGPAILVAVLLNLALFLFYLRVTCRTYFYMRFEEAYPDKRLRVPGWTVREGTVVGFLLIVFARLEELPRLLTLLRLPVQGDQPGEPASPAMAERPSVWNREWWPRQWMALQRKTLEVCGKPIPRRLLTERELGPVSPRVSP